MADEKTPTATDRAREHKALATPIVPVVEPLRKRRISRVIIDVDNGQLNVDFKYAPQGAKAGDKSESLAAAVVTQGTFELVSQVHPPAFEPVRRRNAEWPDKAGWFDAFIGSIEAGAPVLGAADDAVATCEALPDEPEVALEVPGEVAEVAAAAAKLAAPKS